MKNYEIIDNFIDDGYCNFLFNLVNEKDFPWYISDVNDWDTNKYFTHTLFHTAYPSNYFEKFCPLLDKISIKSLIRVKINFYPKTKIIEKHVEHKDFPFDHKAAIFSLNTCNGGTYVEESFIESKKNRLLKFNGNIKHCSTSTDNKGGRININFNYF